MPKKIHITGRRLVQIFSDQLFQRRVRKIIEIMARERREAEFMVYGDFSSDAYFIGAVFRGTATTISNGSLDKHLNPNEDVPFPDFFSMINTHVHGPEYSLFPTIYNRGTNGGAEGDAHYWNEMRRKSRESGYDNKPLGIVCQKAGEQIKLFMVQQTSQKPLAQPSLEKLSRELYGEHDCEIEDLTESDIAKRLQETGNYHAALVTLNGTAGFSERSLRKVREFAYSLKRR